MFGPSTTNSFGFSNSRNPLSRSSTFPQDFHTTSNAIEIEIEDNQIQHNETSNNEDLPLKGLVKDKV